MRIEGARLCEERVIRLFPRGEFLMRAAVSGRPDFRIIFDVGKSTSRSGKKQKKNGMECEFDGFFVQ